jgi:tripartite-type tricarboxylate transporter receptor subunit TctC
MDPVIVRKLQDTFKQTLSDAAVLAILERYDQPVIWMDSEQFGKFILDTYVKEKRTIERLGLGLKS